MQTSVIFTRFMMRLVAAGGDAISNELFVDDDIWIHPVHLELTRCTGWFSIWS